MPTYVYRRGPNTVLNLTPRDPQDLEDHPGVGPGLSVEDDPRSLNLQKGDKYCVIDLDLLPADLRDWPDDPAGGGVAGHRVIAPTAGMGVDQAALAAWAGSRGSDPPHPLTAALLAAVTEVRKVS
jgi:hypothetical protein